MLLQFLFCVIIHGTKNVALANDLTRIIKVNEIKFTELFGLSTHFMNLHITTSFDSKSSQ